MAPPWGSATRLWSRGAPRLPSSKHARAAAPNDVAERHPSDLQLGIQEAVMNSSPDQNEPPVPPRPDPSNPLLNPPTRPGHIREDAASPQSNELPPDPDGSPSQPAADQDHSEP